MADTAARLAIFARRNEVARFTIAVTGIDLTNVPMAMQIRLGRDIPGAPLIALPYVTTLAAEGIKFDGVTVTNGVPTSIIRGRVNASTMTDAAKVPYMGEVGTDSVFAYAMHWILGGDAQTRLYGDFIVVGSAYGSDNAPFSRPMSYSGAGSCSGGAETGSLTFGDQVIAITLASADLVGVEVAKAAAANAAAIAQIQQIKADAVAAQVTAQAAAALAQASLTQTAEVRNTALVQGYLPIGWVEPSDYTGISYRNDYGVRFLSNGLKIWPMLPDRDDTVRSGWRVPGAPRWRHPDDGQYYVGISVARMKDPTTQGVVPLQRYVNNSTGSDTTGDGLTPATAWKTVVPKAIAVINADASPGPWQINAATNDFFGGNSGGWDLGTVPIGSAGKPKWVRVLGVGATKPWRLPGMRNAYTLATFAWTDMGSGIFRCNAAAISANAKNTPIVFDISVLDADGMPTPSRWLAGPYSDEAAIVAAMNAAGPCFHATATPVLYVKLASGLIPNPGVNFAYAELLLGANFAPAEGSRIMIENFRTVYNAANSNASIAYFFRPLTFTQGVAAPHVVHDVEVVLKDVEIYGSSGNAFGMQGVTRWVLEGCKDGYSWLDGVNPHSLYGYPSKSSSILEGSLQHTWIDGHVSLHHGPNGFRNQDVENMSANAFTDHERGVGTIINSRGGFSNGSTFAIVGGAQWLALNVNSFGPKYVTPAEDTYTTPWLSSGHAAGDATIGSAIFGIYCTGSVRPNGRMFYVSTVARMVQAHFRGRVSKVVEGTGSLTDGYGGNL